MEFSPNNKIIQLCLQGMGMEAQNKLTEAGLLFLQAWNEATNDFEKFIAAYYVAKSLENVSEKLKWFGIALQHALMINDESVRSAFSSLYVKIAECYEALDDDENAKKNHEAARSFTNELSDKGPFYHGTKADLNVGDLLTAGNSSNYKSELVMNHVYFTALINGAGLAAALAKGDGRERVYIVEPTGPIENDPNVTDKKFPGNLTRSYRSQAPLRIVGEAGDWKKTSNEEVSSWKEKLEKNKGDIIN
jgi:hypothetical protein